MALAGEELFNGEEALYLPAEVALGGGDGIILGAGTAALTNSANSL